MTNQSAHLDDAYNEMAEGSPANYEREEPDSALRTTVSPVVKSSTTTRSLLAETGILSRIDVKAEGNDEDEAQDSSPTSDETKPATAPELSTAYVGSNSMAPTILIVEDSIELAEVIQATLERKQMNTVHETHGVKALDQLETIRPDLILLDISLPDITGWKILEGIKNWHERSKANRMPVIVVITAMDDPANRLVGKLQEVHSYLVKPFTPDQVENAVLQALSNVAQ